MFLLRNAQQKHGAGDEKCRPFGPGFKENHYRGLTASGYQKFLPGGPPEEPSRRAGLKRGVWGGGAVGYIKFDIS